MLLRGHASRRAIFGHVVVATRATRATRAARATLTALVVGATFVASSASAQSPVTVTFDALAAMDPSAGINYVDNCYVEMGLRVSVDGMACGDPYAFGTYTPDDPTGYTGSPALFNNMGFGVTFASAMTGPFSLYSIDLAPILLGGFAPDPVTVTFMGSYLLGGTVSQTLMVPAGVAGLSTYALTGFTGLASVTMTPSAPDYSVQFDNISAGVTATPEPTTVVLLGGGLLALAGATRRRRRTT